MDTQISRLGGPNFHEIPINAPLAQVHNNQRDGMHRQAIHRGRVSYEPNSLGGGCPFQAGRTGFVSFPEPRSVGDHKVRGKAERFADHYTQATLFWNSQTEVEQAHIVNAFTFELAKCQVPAIRERMVSSLMNVATELAERVAAGLGLARLPAAMPLALNKKVTPEVLTSPALSLFAIPGDQGIRTRQVAILVADGVDGRALQAIGARLAAEGAVPRWIGPTLAPVHPASGDPIAVDTAISTTKAGLFDAVVVPDGAAGVDWLAADRHVVQFVRDQYHQCKPILMLGAARRLLEKAGIPAELPDGSPDPGLVLGTGENGSVDSFVAALAKHRHFERELEEQAH